MKNLGLTQAIPNVLFTLLLLLMFKKREQGAESPIGLVLAYPMLKL